MPQASSVMPHTPLSACVPGTTGEHLGGEGRGLGLFGAGKAPEGYYRRDYEFDLDRPFGCHQVGK